MGENRHQFESCIEYRIYNAEKIVESIANAFSVILDAMVEAKEKDEKSSCCHAESIKTDLMKGRLRELSDVLGAFKAAFEAKKAEEDKPVEEAKPVDDVNLEKVEVVFDASTGEKKYVPKGWDKIENAKQE